MSPAPPVGANTSSSTALPPVQSRVEVKEHTPALAPGDQAPPQQPERSKQATPLENQNPNDQTNGSLKHDLEDKSDNKTLKKPSVAPEEGVQKRDDRPNGSSADQQKEGSAAPEKAEESTRRDPGPASAPGPSVNPQPVVTDANASNNNGPQFSKNVTEGENKEENEKEKDNEDEEEEKKQDPVEPPLRKVDEDENYDDE